MVTVRMKLINYSCVCEIRTHLICLAEKNESHLFAMMKTAHGFSIVH